MTWVKTSWELWVIGKQTLRICEWTSVSTRVPFPLLEQQRWKIWRNPGMTIICWVSMKSFLVVKWINSLRSGKMRTIPFYITFHWRMFILQFSKLMLKLAMAGATRWSIICQKSALILHGICSKYSRLVASMSGEEKSPESQWCSCETNTFFWV